MTRTCEAVTFIPHEIQIPKVMLTDHIKQAADDLITLLTAPPSNLVACLQEGDPVRNTLLDIVTQLKRAQPIEEPPSQDDAHVRVES